MRPNDVIPDVRDGLTRLERVILFVLHETQRELKGRNVPATMLYGRVLERIDVAEDEFRRALESVLRREANSPSGRRPPTADR